MISLSIKYIGYILGALITISTAIFLGLYIKNGKIPFFPDTRRRNFYRR